MNLLKKINLFKKRKVMYLMFLGIVVLLGVVLSTTYAKFPDSFVTANDIVEINLGFSIDITDMQEYQEINVDPFTTTRFNIQVTNNSNTTVYYGMWYDMIIPNVLPVDGSIEVGWITGTTGPTSGELAGLGSSAASIAVVNNTGDTIKLYIGVNSSTTSTSDIEYLDGKHLITDEITTVGSKDINIVYVSVDGGKVSGIPTVGAYTMEYNCQLGSTLRWDNFTKSIIYEAGSKVGDKCSLEFTTDDNYQYPLLSSVPVGSYVAYEGVGGTVGSTAVSCKKGGSASSSTATNATEAPNSCLGQNAREDLDTNAGTYGYCYSENFKYYVTGWRVAYVDENGKPVIISAGSPQCITRTASSENVTYIQTANAAALKYCNPKFVNGDCSCASTTSGRCSTPSEDAWAMGDTDFYHITKATSGIGKRLVRDSSSLGDEGSYLYYYRERLYCEESYSRKECGYGIDLIDNGGWYWFASRGKLSTSEYANYGVFWEPDYRDVDVESYTYAYGFRPVISLSASVYITGGIGTMKDPYIIDNNTDNYS